MSDQGTLTWKIIKAWGKARADRKWVDGEWVNTVEDWMAAGEAHLKELGIEPDNHNEEEGESESESESEAEMEVGDVEEGGEEENGDEKGEKVVAPAPPRKGKAKTNRIWKSKKRKAPPHIQARAEESKKRKAAAKQAAAAAAAAAGEENELDEFGEE